MSRVGKSPIVLPAGVKLAVSGRQVEVRGPKGGLSLQCGEGVSLSLAENTVTVARVDDSPSMRALHGTTRALVNNMVLGVSAGWHKVLQIEGVGYRSELQGKTLVMMLGYSHPVRIDPPAGIDFEVDLKARTITVRGIDRELVGQTAANLRAWRPPEPYKGKGVRYLGEKVRRKAGKSGKAK